MKLLQGNCLDLLTTIPDGSVDMVFADLPYGVTANKWDSVIPFGPLWEQLLRVGKRNAAFVFTATQPFTSRLVASQERLFKYGLVWQKSRCTGVFLAKSQPLRYHEDVVVFYRAQPTYNPQLEQGKPYKFTRRASKSKTIGTGNQVDTVADNDGARFPKSVQFFASEVGMHPTQKPVALLEWLVKTYTNPGDTVLDPTMGSGTTGVACVNTGRNFVGIEMDVGYFTTAEHRISHAQKPEGDE